MGLSTHCIFLWAVVLWTVTAQVKAGCSNANARLYYPQLAAAHLDLSLDVLRTNVRTSTNFAISPLSLGSTLHALSLGVGGDTLNDVLGALTYGLNIPGVSSVCDCYMTDVSNGGALSRIFSFDLTLGLNNNQRLASGYLSQVRARLGTTVGFLDTLVGGLDALLGSTGNLLGNVFSSVGRLLGFAVKSVFNFDCGWRSSFDVSLTGPRNFYDLDGRARQGQFMHRSGRYRYGVFADFSVLEMPYQEDGLSLVLYLPHKRDGLLNLQSSLTADYLNRLLGNLVDDFVDVAIPRFTLDLTADLTGALKGLGLASLFDENNRDFSGMLSSSISGVSRMVQRTLISLTEGGCSSRAAGSSYGGGYRAAGRVDFCADHPFLFSIVRKVAGQVNVNAHLQIGVVNNIG